MCVRGQTETDNENKRGRCDNISDPLKQNLAEDSTKYKHSESMEKRKLPKYGNYEWSHYIEIKNNQMINTICGKRNSSKIKTG